MATFKHISSKNADYGAAEAYLTFEHDEFTMKPTLDGNGRLILREDYRISSLNCGSEDFAIACMRSNLRYGKNQKREDVKSHHYIISFDPRDAPDNGLTVDRAQELGEQFCKEHFPGHQALVCTHPDGHNHSGKSGKYTRMAKVQHGTIYTVLCRCCRRKWRCFCMGNPNLVPYETIVRATSGEPEAVDEDLRHNGKQIRLAALENGHINQDTEDSIKQRLITALFQFRFDEQPYLKTE